jgi:hypothetical protein
MAGIDYRDARDSAASAGTLAHALVEGDIRGVPSPQVPLTDEQTKALKAFENYKEWAAQTQLTPVKTETRLISERHKYGGTIDAMLVGGKLSLGDWKTSNAVYPDYLIQLAAYGLLWTENFPDQPIEGGYHLLRFSKDTADFVHYHFGELDEAAEAFLLMRRLYDLDKVLRARVR